MKIEWSDVGIWLIYGLMAACVIFVVFVGVDAATGHAEYENGIIVDKVFSPGKTGTGVGPAITGNGGGVAVAIVTTQDEWHVLVEMGGDILDAETSRARWVKLKVGDAIVVRHWIGGISKDKYSSRVSHEDKQ